MAEQATPVRIELDVSKTVPNPEGANFFALGTVGSEVQMLVGYVNLMQLASGGKAVPQVTHCFVLSPFGFGQLAQQVDRIRSGVNDPGAKWEPIPIAESRPA